MIAAIGFDQNPLVMPYAGLWQRLALIIGLGWLGLLAWRMRMAAEPAGSSGLG